MNAVYLEGSSNDLKHFICSLPDDNKNTVAVNNSVVAKGAFKSASFVENVHFEKCERIEEFAFENCVDLRTVIWIENTKSNPKTYKITGKIEESMDDNKTVSFEGEMTEESDDEDTPKTDSIFGIRIPTLSGLEIQRGAFKNCSNLQTVILPKSTNIVIEKEAFGGCQNLRTIVFPFIEGQVVVISEDAIVNCSKVTFVCSEKSVAANRYAREHGFEIVNIEG